MPIPIPRLNDDFPLDTLAWDKGTLLAEIAPEECRQAPSIRQLEEEYLRGHDIFTPIPGREGWMKNSKGQLLYAPDLSKLGPRKPPKTPSKLWAAALKKPPIVYSSLKQALEALNSAAKNLPSTRTFTKGDLCRTLLDPDVMSFDRVRGHSEMYGGDYETGEGIFDQKDPNQKLYPCDPDGWIPHTPGDPMPCPGEQKVLIRIKDDPEATAPGSAEMFDWLAMRWEIVAWKPVL